MTTAGLKSLENLHPYVQVLAARHPEDDRRLHNMEVARQATWLLILALTSVGNRLLDTMSEALSLL